MDLNNQKKHNTVGIIALILLLLIILTAGGLFWLYKTEKVLAKESADKTKITQPLVQAGSASGSGITSFYDRIKLLYESYKTDSQKKSGSGSKSSGGSSSGSGSAGQSSGVGGMGGEGVLDTDVPWREEGEPDLDYSNLEVRACGAAVKEPPTDTIGTEEFEQAYHDYLAWIDADCRAAYSEAGIEYPF